MAFSSGEPATSDFFFAGSHAVAAELKLAYAIEQGLELALIVGDPGLGKTKLLRRAAAKAAADGHAVVDVYFSCLDVDSLLAFLEDELNEFEGSSARRLDGGRNDRLHRIACHARRLAEDGRGIVLAIDDAHLVRDAAVFETLHLLLNLRERENSRVTILLAGQRTLLSDLGRVPALAQRVAVTATLAPFDATATASYVRDRLRCEPATDVAFSNEALERVHDVACGVPRRIDRLCAMARLVASLDDRTCVGCRDVDQVASEFGLGIETAA